MKSVNLTHYYLTENGVISKLDTYWDVLNDITNQMEKITKQLIKHLFYSGSFFLLHTILAFWLDLDKTWSIFSFSLITTLSFIWIGFQWSKYWEYQQLKKKGMILYDELNNEFDWKDELGFSETIPMEERILLNHFLLISEFPINKTTYQSILIMIPLVVIGFGTWYYFFL